jgi:hypothetical protein
MLPNGARVLRDRDNRDCVATVYRKERGPRRFGRNLVSGENSERPRGPGSRAGNTLESQFLDLIEFSKKRESRI